MSMNPDELAASIREALAPIPSPAKLPQRQIVHDQPVQRGPSEEQLHAQVQQQAKQSTNDDPPDARAWIFSFEHTTERGEVLRGSFKHTIPDASDRLEKAKMAAQLRNGQPVQAFLPEDIEDQEMLAYLITCLDRGIREPWAKNLTAIEDPGVLRALYAKCEAHTAKYFRRGKYSKKV